MHGNLCRAAPGTAVMSNVPRINPLLAPRNIHAFEFTIETFKNEKRVDTLTQQSQIKKACRQIRKFEKVNSTHNLVPTQ